MIIIIIFYYAMGSTAADNVLCSYQCIFTMQYNKTKSIIGHHWKLFPSVEEILPLAFGLTQYFQNFGKTIYNNDLSASNYSILYDPELC